MSKLTSMVEPVNLNKYRKSKARADKIKTAAENRLKFGRTKAEKLKHQSQDKNAVTFLDGHKRDRKHGDQNDEPT